MLKVESEQLMSSAELPDEVLKVWDVESSHKYENNQHSSQVKITLTFHTHSSQVKITLNSYMLVHLLCEK